MLDEEMDHMIREAAENHHPPYNDKAWAKMELQLDKHLPQKKDRRRWIFFLLFFLMAGAGFVFTINYFTGNKGPLTEERSDNNKEPGQLTTQTIPQQAGPGKDQVQDTKSSEEATDQTNSNSPNDKTTSIITSLQQEKDKNNSLDRGNNKKFTLLPGKAITKPGFVGINPLSGSADKDVLAKNKPITGKTTGKMNVIVTGALAETNEDETMALNSAGIKTRENAKPGSDTKNNTGKENIKVNDKKEKDVVLTENKPLTTADKKKPKKNIAGNFGLTVSVGPDLSFIKLNKPGKATLTYGAGLSYNFAKRFTVRSGVYFSKKIYVAAPDQYHAVTYPNLTSIDADCKLIEIPIGFSYGFGQRNKHNWVANVGLSSFIMKNEGYNYNYKNAAGQTYSYYREISNENKHYLAVLNLSGGYNYQLNKRVSIQAEPYVKLPLSGVGLGKMKLKSSGILFTVTVKPFAKGSK